MAEQGFDPTCGLDLCGKNEPEPENIEVMSFGDDSKSTVSGFRSIPDSVNDVNSPDNESDVKSHNQTDEEGASSDQDNTTVPTGRDKSENYEDMEQPTQRSSTPREVDPEDVERNGSRAALLCTAVMCVKYLYSMLLLGFCIVVLMGAIFVEQTDATRLEGVPSALSFLIFWLLIIWLFVLEGGQGAIVGLQPVDKSLYAASHPIALMSTALTHKGDNMERFIVGRQFLVVMVIFGISWHSITNEDASVLGMSDTANEAFLASGVAVILITTIVGQLVAQINTATCMLDFINSYYMLFTIYCSFAVEASGLLHAVYLIQMIFSKLTGKSIESNEEPRSGSRKFLFWARGIVSVAILGFSLAVTISALVNRQTTMWKGMPTYVGVVMFFGLLCFMGLMEGMQIALFSVVNLSEEELKQHKIADATCKLVFSREHLQTFLIGRQMCVTLCTFLLARITAHDVNTDNREETVFGVSDGVQEFFNTGLLGALVTTILGSLVWRIIASSFPIGFLSNPLIYLLTLVSYVLEASGVCSAAWVLAAVHKKLVGMQTDEVYIGSLDDRSEIEQKDLQMEEIA